ncbi:MAG: NAD-dependent epimerase/dehydratase family protein [Bacteroidales bacterium]|nr:NAD-dependent epimerase/dehydratase family protein [Bacteroidales bacterium]
MPKILITCVGSGVGQSVLDSANITGAYEIIGCDVKRNVYAYNLCNKLYIAPTIYDDNYLEFIIDICNKENVSIVIPGHDHELLVFSKNRQLFEENNIEVLVSSPYIIEISRDKYKWHEYFKELGCSIVPTFKVSDFISNPDDSLLPAIIKPSGGSASQGITIINDISEMVNTTLGTDIIQPYLFPLKDDENYKSILKAVESGKFVQLSEISIQLVFTKKSKFAGIFISKNTLKSGVPMFIDPIDPDSFEYIEEIKKFIPILIKKKVKGPVNIQGRITKQGLIFFEMNMRFTGITGNRAQLGFNEVNFLVNDFLELPAKLEGYSKNKLGVRQVACTTIPRIKNKYEKLNYMITGASGFIGSHFVSTLIKEMKHGEIFLLCGNESIEKYYELYSNYRQIKIVKENDILVESKFNISDVFINFASSLVDSTNRNTFDAIHFQYRQANRVRRANIPIVINISSQSVYNQKDDILKEESGKTDLDDLYSFQKYLGEDFFKSIHIENPAIKVISLRFGRVIGNPSDMSDPKGFFAHLIRALINNEEVNIPYPQNKINLLDVRDAISAIFQIIDHSSILELPDLINIGGTNISIKEYCKKVVECVLNDEKNKLIKYSDSQEITISSMINMNLAKESGIKTKYSVRDTINDMHRQIVDNIGKSE